MKKMETKENNEVEVNIADILRYAPKGLKLYSPIFGEVKFKEIDDDNCVVIDDKYNNHRWFYEYGTFFPSDENNFSEGECLLFPSINHRCWNNWQNTLFLDSIGSVCVDTITGNKFILGEDGTYFGDNTGNSFHFLIDDEDASNYLLNSRYASPEEAISFIEELEKNGYEWDGKKVVKKGNIKPKFKVGDIIRNEPTGVFMAIKEIKDDSYITTDGTMLLFKYQDRWELAGKAKLSLEAKVSVLADEILALKQRVKALEIQVIKDMSTPPLTKDPYKDPYLNPNKVTCDDTLCHKGNCMSDVFKTQDKAGDNVTLKDMKS